MKFHNFNLILFFVVVYFFSCVDTKVFLQQVEIEGPMIQPMTKITNNKNVDEIETSVRVLVNKKEKLFINTNGHTYVNGAGEYIIEEVPGEDYFIENIGDNLYQFKGNNTSWVLPEFQLGLNMDFPISNNFSFSGGLDYSNVNSSSYWNGNLGLGFFKELKNSAWRFDVILNHTYIKSKVDYILTKHYSRDDFKYVYFYNKELSDAYTDFKLMITFNTKNIRFPVDLFFNVSFGSQRYFDDNVVAVNEKEEIELKNNPVNIGLGIYKNITPRMRVILGTTIINQTQRNPAIAYPVYSLQLDSYLFSGD